MRWAFAVVALASGVVHAEPEVADVAPEAAAATPPTGYGALPGGLHVASAETPDAGTAGVSLVGGYGYRKGLLGPDHTLNRAIGQVALAYAPIAPHVIALSLDGRYDKHSGLSGMSDDGYVGDPHLLVRLAKPFGTVSLGGQVGIWVPGKNAPSIVAAATSVDLRGLLSVAAGPGTLSLDAGFRIDNSASSVDHPEQLSVEDRASLGVSDYHAALLGVQYRLRTGKRAWLAFEASTDIFVGSGAPGPIVRGGVLAGIAVTDAIAVVAFLEGAKVPGLKYSDVMAGQVTLIPYEPIVTAGLGLQAHFGAKRGTAVHVNERPELIEVPETADVSGTVVDDLGKPVVGAKVTVKLTNHTGDAVTDDKGAWSVGKLPIGKTVGGKTVLDDTGAEITAEVEGKKPGKTTVVLAKGPNAVGKLTLDPLLPPGQLRAVITNLGTSKPVAGATVKIEPGGLSATSGPDGKFTIDLAPGQYKITVTAQGLAPQQLDVTIEQNGVAIKNIDMHK